jgi:hypothetical protein
MEAGTTGGEEAEQISHTHQQEPTPKGTERSPSIILTASVNLLKFQGEIKGPTKGNFELRSSRTGIRVVTKEMADYRATMRHLHGQKLPYYTFHTKLKKKVKAVVRYPPGNTAAEDAPNKLVTPGFSVISVQ